MRVHRSTASIASLGLVALLAGLPTAASASIVFQQAQCVSSEGCDQTINFNPSAGGPITGTVIVGDTNPAPVYLVKAESIETPQLTLHGAGSHIANDTAKDGWNKIEIYVAPGEGYAWDAFEFQLDHLKPDNNAPFPSGTIQLEAYSLLINAWVTDSLDFPYEGDNGENQHYKITASGGDLFDRIRIIYDSADYRIHEVHNIDVHSVSVPEPSGLALVGLGLIGACLTTRRRA